MHRFLLIPFLVLSGCSLRAPSPPPAPAAPQMSAPESLDERKAACGSLINHLVDLATANFAAEHELPPGSTHKLKAKVATALKEDGVLDRVVYECMISMDKSTLECEIHAQNLDEVQVCEGEEPHKEVPKPPSKTVTSSVFAETL